MMKKRNRKGFTLIELVIVIAVLALLAAVAVPAVGGIIDDAKASSDESNVALFQGAIERYNADNGKYPTRGTSTDTEYKAAVTGAIQKYTNVSSVAAPKQGGHFYYIYDAVKLKGTIGYAVAIPSGAVQLD